MSDVNYWFTLCDGICPNCGLDLKKQSPFYNVLPHFYGDCKFNDKKQDNELCEDSHHG